MSGEIWLAVSAIVQAATAVAVGFFTWRLWRIEVQRDRQAARAQLLFSVDVGGIRVDYEMTGWSRPNEFWPKVATHPIFLKNHGAATAVACTISWDPFDSRGQPDFYRPITSLTRIPNRFNLSPNAVHNFYVEISPDGARDGFPEAHKRRITRARIDGPRHVGYEFDLGIVAVTWQDHDCHNEERSLLTWRWIEDENKEFHHVELLINSVST